MEISTLTAILTALGGIEFIRYLFQRKAVKRKANAEADTEVFHSLKEYNEFLQQQLQMKEERFQDQTMLVRKLNTEVIDLTKQQASLELELAKVRCVDQECPFRRPPNAQTPPPPGVERDAWHRARSTATAKDDAELMMERKI